MPIHLVFCKTCHLEFHTSGRILHNIPYCNPFCLKVIMAEGLGLAVRSGIQTIPAEYFLVSDTAENLITVSNLLLQKKL